MSDWISMASRCGGFVERGALAAAPIGAFVT
jgi:hypothetical protein